MKALRNLKLVVEFGREFEGEIGFLAVPDWRGDLRWLAGGVEGELLRGKRDVGMGKVEVECVILTRGGEQA